MSKTNCVNCGASKESTDLQCPFCGTKYADFTTFDLMHDDILYIQLSKNGKPVTAKAYITNKTLKIHPNTLDMTSINGIRRHLTVSNNISGSIDFTLYEAI